MGNHNPMGLIIEGNKKKVHCLLEQKLHSNLALLPN